MWNYSNCFCFFKIDEKCQIHHVDLGSRGGGPQSHWILANTEHFVSLGDPRGMLFYTRYSINILQVFSPIYANIIYLTPSSMRYSVHSQFYLQCQWTGIFGHVHSLFDIICLADLQVVIPDIFVSEIASHKSISAGVSKQIHFVPYMFHMH